MEVQRCLLERILDGAEDPTDLPLALLQDITDNFSDERKIGQGGFGVVYKGVLGERFVAVKRIHINENTVDDRLFRREFVSLWNTSHRNVVRFLGFCSNTYQKTIEDSGSGEIALANILERLLCFEYVSNGSLDKHITDELRGLEWETRYEIITGICKGLRYLHEEKSIIHMDLKPANILLHHQDDKYIVPKITDFGLSRPNQNSHTVGLCFGTLGYMAPEYREGSKTTPACDIYSLGAIIIELVTGCKDIPHKNNVLRRWRHRWSKPPTQLRYQQVTRCMEIARRCREENPEARPSISKIISFLKESESAYGPISPCLDEDDMLRINPLKLSMPCELNSEISHSVELTNDTLNCIAFNIQPPSAQPVKGIVQPGSTYAVAIIVQARDVREHNHVDKFIVQSMKWIEGLGQEDIIECMSGAEARKVVDEVDLMVVYETTKAQENCKHGGDTKMPTEEVPKANKIKIVELATRKGGKIIGINENPEAASMVMTSNARGQYTGQLDRRNFHPPEIFSHSQATNMTYLLRDSDRAMDVTRGAMGSLLHKLGVLDKEFNLKTSVEKDAEELVKMQQVLRKVSDLQQDNLDDLVKRWACNVRDMSYELEDFVDGFLVHSEPDSDGSNFRELTHKICFCLEKGKSHQLIVDLIKHHVSKQVQYAAEKFKEYKVGNIVPNASAKAVIDDLRILSIYKDKEKLVGIDTPRDELIRLFEEGGNVSKQELRIVSIVGLGGLGKTTLSKAVYEKLKAQHDFQAFVSVGQNPDVKKVLNNIIGKFVANPHKKKKNAENLGELIEKLQELLMDKRYFIVIDDIWDVETWDIIKYAFPRNHHGCRVITTTRNERVAHACCHPERRYVYKIKPLSHEDSRILFFKKIFGPGKNCPDAQKDIIVDILKKCGGMPLAINSIACLLADQPRSTWDYVWKSLGALTEGNNGLENMTRILDLSYVHLPAHLRACLLYICKYRENEEIDKKGLLRQWIAEGFVCTTGGQDSEDVAENYFTTLINMCMIQPGKMDYYNDEVLSCRVHDIILDLMRSKSSEMNFFHVVDGLKDVSGQVHRVSVENNNKKDSRILETINKGSLKHVRSVLLYRASLVPYFLKYNYVRVLQIDRAYSKDLLDLTDIRRLFLLRYLQITGSILFPCELMLPEKIGQLQQLETIDLEGVKLENYPSDIADLPRLSHLIFRGEGRGVVLPDEMGRLTSLRTLGGVCLSGSSVENIEGLGELNKLRELRIQELHIEPGEASNIRMEALHSSICKLSASLRILYLGLRLDLRRIGHYRYYWSSSIFPRVSNIRELELEFCSFRRCPSWIGQLHNLYKLRIAVREVADAVSIVARLPSLSYLCLEIDTYEEEKEESVVICGSSGAFQALKHLIFHCSNASLTFEEGALPKLEKLDMHFIPHRYRRFLPAVGIEHLPAPTLEDITLSVSMVEHCWECNVLPAPAGPQGSERYNKKLTYLDSQQYSDKLRKQLITLGYLMKRAFKEHHPGATISICFEDYMYNYTSDDDATECCNEEAAEGALMLMCLPRSLQLCQLTSLQLSTLIYILYTESVGQLPSTRLPLYLQELSVQAPEDWESLELPFARSLPSYRLEPMSELSGQVQHSDPSSCFVQAGLPPFN